MRFTHLFRRKQLTCFSEYGDGIWGLQRNVEKLHQLGDAVLHQTIVCAQKLDQGLKSSANRRLLKCNCWQTAQTCSPARPQEVYKPRVHGRVFHTGAGVSPPGNRPSGAGPGRSPEERSTGPANGDRALAAIRAQAWVKGYLQGERR